VIVVLQLELCEQLVKVVDGVRNKPMELVSLALRSWPRISRAASRKPRAVSLTLAFHGSSVAERRA